MMNWDWIPKAIEELEIIRKAREEEELEKQQEQPHYVRCPDCMAKLKIISKDNSLALEFIKHAN